MLGRENGSNHNKSSPAPSRARRRQISTCRDGHERRADGRLGKTGVPFPPVLMPLRIVAQPILNTPNGFATDGGRVTSGDLNVAYDPSAPHLSKICVYLWLIFSCSPYD